MEEEQREAGEISLAPTQTEKPPPPTKREKHRKQKKKNFQFGERFRGILGRVGNFFLSLFVGIIRGIVTIFQWIVKGIIYVTHLLWELLKLIFPVLVRIFPFILIVGAIVAIIIGARSCDAKKYGAENVSAIITQKTNTETREESTRTRYTTRFYITVVNECSIEIIGLSAEMAIYAAEDGKTLWEGTIDLSGTVPTEGGEGYWWVDVYTYDEQLWNYPLEGLTVEWSITLMEFMDGEGRDYSMKPKTIYQGTAEYHEKLYMQALDLFGQGKYAEAKSVFESLGEYRDSSEYLLVCEDKIFYAEMVNKLQAVAGNAAILPDDCRVYSYSDSMAIDYQSNTYYGFYASVVVPAEEKDTFLQSFREKLLNGGFLQAEEFVYTRGYTVIRLGEVTEGYNNYSLSYEAFLIG